MKSLTLCCLVLLLSLICHRTHGASLQGNEHNTETQNLELEIEESSVLLFRQKRHSVLSICRFCCKCCGIKDCGMCCRT
ncbi:hypothetical protein GDO86_012198 [Hymenochirus boettgeri]|uniref:Hepcidin n=1 Tax=Hymenochirus boettgeri TaxID=247094 RepID=A0A8T2ILD3_9PIPI|nr:hypothetical protein GDO86_012198 [Hymenochirus boettgeri]